MSPFTFFWRKTTSKYQDDLLTCLENFSEPQFEAPAVTNIVLDGAAIVQMLKPSDANSFKEYADKIYLPYILGQLWHEFDTHVVLAVVLAETLSPEHEVWLAFGNGKSFRYFAAHS